MTEPMAEAIPRVHIYLGSQLKLKEQVCVDYNLGLISRARGIEITDSLQHCRKSGAQVQYLRECMMDG